MNKKFYITTPIYYVNDKPHIGHACTTVAADIVARYHKLLGEEVFFLTGTDEHGAKVAEEAAKAGIDPQTFCDKVSQTFQDIWPKLGIQTDYFIRTTNPDHKKIVQEVIQKIYDKGDIYKAKYEGFYCVGCEKFIAETDVVDGRCPLHPTLEIQKQSEENYFFKLSKYVPDLIKAIENPDNQNHYLVSPPGKKEEVLSKLKSGITDLSISRANVSWGIPIPWDTTQTIYVWFDALLNYYTALKITGQEKFWPADLHLLGKEILWFHAVIWEAMLLSAEISLPKEVFAHSFYMIDGQKMSKSLGNVITPEELINKFGVDGARYLIASSFPRDDDSDVGWEKFTIKYNANLANGLGNLVARIAKLCEKSEFSFPVAAVNVWERKNFLVAKHLDNLQFDKALSYIWEHIKRIDKEIDEKQPWVKQGKDLENILSKLRIDLLEIASGLLPFIPETAEKIQKQFARPKIKAEAPLFPRI
ncbi:MAG: methionine--tRNA ligase [bacterium]|nr:methionine--tRNA ligase [bacterium]